MTEHEHLEVEDRGRVRWLTLARPEKRNAITAAMAAGVAQELGRAATDEGVGAVVVRGAGAIFTGGVDVTVFTQALDPDRLAPLSNIHEVLRGFDKPLLACVHGKAVGMGVTLLPCFDLVYAARDATFQTPFVRLGLVLEYGSSFTLPRLIGRQRTNELVLRARPIDAETMCRWGLVTRVFDADALVPTVQEIAADIADNPAGAVADSKRLIRQGEGEGFAACVERENEVLFRRYGSPETLAAVTAFLTKRR